MGVYEEQELLWMLMVQEWGYLLQCVTFELYYAWPPNLGQSANEVEDRLVIVCWCWCSTHAGSGLCHCVGEWY